MVEINQCFEFQKSHLPTPLVYHLGVITVMAYVRVCESLLPGEDTMLQLKGAHAISPIPSPEFTIQKKISYDTAKYPFRQFLAQVFEVREEDLQTLHTLTNTKEGKAL